MKFRKIVTFVIILSLITSLTSFANSGEKPSIVIMTTNAPDDLRVTFIQNGEEVEVYKNNTFIEDYYIFYSWDLNNDERLILSLESKEGSFTLDIEDLELYSSFYRLDYKNRTLTPGKGILRSVILISIRLSLTLLIEGFIFSLFLFTEKKSWRVFFITNLVTQGLLNLFINTMSPTVGSYIVVDLVYTEVLILLIELVVFTYFIKERKGSTIFLYVCSANIASLILGAIIIPMLPI